MQQLVHAQQQQQQMANTATATGLVYLTDCMASHSGSLV